MNAVARWSNDTLALAAPSQFRFLSNTSARRVAEQMRAAIGLSGSASGNRVECDDTEVHHGTVLRTLEDLTGDAVFGKVIRADIKRLDDLAQLEQDWDSYEASRISPDAISMTYLLMANVAGSLAFRLGDRVRPYVIAPLADGGVQVEWRGPGGAIEVEVNPDESLNYLWLQHDQPSEEDDGVSLEEIQEMILAVLRG